MENKADIDEKKANNDLQKQRKSVSTAIPYTLKKAAAMMYDPIQIIWNYPNTCRQFSVENTPASTNPTINTAALSSYRIIQHIEMKQDFMF